MAADVTPLRSLRSSESLGTARTLGTPRTLGTAKTLRAAEPSLPEPLWREVLGSRLRELRRERQEKLTETAGRAGISPQYLSEVERGLKEPSSEMIAALAGAFGLTLIDLTTLVTEDLRRQAGQPLRLRNPQGAQEATAPAAPSGPVALLAVAA
jgi:transcriptional regulator with XRE-family HTH domain